MTDGARDAQAIYLFCFTRSGLISSIEGMGIDGHNPLFLHEFRGIAAVVSVISLSELSGPETEARMQDLAWIGPRALHHEQVIEQVMPRSPAFPARFGTLFSSLEKLDELLITHHDTISHFLSRMVDREEWSVKAFLNRKKAREEYIAAALAAQAQHLPQSPGARYLQEQRIRTGAEKEVNHRVSSIGQRIWRELNSLADEVSERKLLPSADPADIEGEMVLNWAFLVQRNNLAGFQKAIDDAKEASDQVGLVIRYSGPWPPYSFTPHLPVEPET